MKKIVLFGAGGFARETAYLIERINNVRAAYELLGFIVDDDYYRDGLEINGYPVLGTRQWLITHKNEVVCTCAIGEPGPREAIQEELEQKGIQFETLISPDVVIAAGSAVFAKVRRERRVLGNPARRFEL